MNLKMMLKQYQQQEMSEGFPKSKSFDMSRKPKSFTKLPKLPENPTDKRKENHQHETLGQKNKQNKSEKNNKNSFLMKLEPIVNQQQKKHTSRSINQQEKQETKPQRLKKNQSVLDIRQSIKDKLDERSNAPEQKNQIKIGLTTIGTDAQSDNSSRQAIHPIITQITNLISQQTQKQIVATKMYDKKALGQLSGLWWCAVDTLLISLQKLIKVRKFVEKQEKKERKIIRNRKKQQQNEQEGQQLRLTQGKVQKKHPKGKALTKIKPSIEMAKVYCLLQPQITANQKIIIRDYEDPNHVYLILQGFFFQKVLIYLIGSVKKWNHPDQQFQIHNLAVEILPYIIETRKLVIDILMQAVENEADDKIKKPKYIAREKKLIQISKYTTLMKSQLEKCLQHLGSPNRYKIFQYGFGFKDYQALAQLESKWRHLVFSIPIAPFLPASKQKKQYLLILQPLHILYKYNKKQEFLLVDPQAGYFLEELGKLFDIVFFTHMDKQSSLLNFMGFLDRLEIMGILDKHHLTYKGAKKIKDLSKVGGGYDQKKILVVDDKQNHKYYVDAGDSLYLINSNRTQIRAMRIKGKLIKMQDDDEDFLRNLARKINKCAQKGGNWKDLSKD